MDHGQLSMVADKFQWVFSETLLNACGTDVKFCRRQRVIQPLVVAAERIAGMDPLLARLPDHLLGHGVGEVELPAAADAGHHAGVRRQHRCDRGAPVVAASPLLVLKTFVAKSWQGAQKRQG